MHSVAAFQLADTDGEIDPLFEQVDSLPTNPGAGRDEDLSSSKTNKVTKRSCGAGFGASCFTSDAKMF